MAERSTLPAALIQEIEAIENSFDRKVEVATADLYTRTENLIHGQQEIKPVRVIHNSKNYELALRSSNKGPQFVVKPMEPDWSEEIILFTLEGEGTVLESDDPNGEIGDLEQLHRFAEIVDFLGAQQAVE